MSSRHIPATDGVSRFFSLIALVIAIGSAFFLYQENQKLKAELSALNGPDAATFATHANDWDKTMTGALDEFKVRSDKYLKDFDQARIARNDIVDAQTLTQADVEAIIENHVVAKPVLPPNLVIAQSRLKPIDGSSAPVVIGNDGGIHAEIVAARFLPTPSSQFKTDLPPIPDDNQVLIRFSPSHNKPTKANHHRLYERKYFLPEQAVAPDRTAKVTVEISNDKHVDWGMKGKLELEYQDGKTITIPSVEAIFVPEKVETT